MKSTDLKTRNVMDFDSFKEAYSRSTIAIQKDPDALTQDGARKMVAFPSHVRNDSNPFRAFGIPYDKEEADSNMRINAMPPLVATTNGLNSTSGNVGE